MNEQAQITTQLEAFRARQLAYAQSVDHYSGAIDAFVAAIIDHVANPTEASKQALIVTAAGVSIARKRTDEAQFNRVINSISLQQLAGIIGGEIEQSVKALTEEVDALKREYLQHI